MAQTVKQLNDKLDAIAEDVAVIREILTGDGDPSKGLVVRVDRMEQDTRRRNWFTHTTFGASIVALVGLVLRILFH